jgi:hypothetical protein
MRLPTAHSRSTLLRSLAAMVPALVAFPPLPAARADGGALEEVRKAASLIPGYGPPDLLFPGVFRGRYRVVRTVVSVETPLGRDKAPRAELEAAESSKELQCSYDARFVDVADESYAGLVIPDRAFNAEQKESAITGTPLADLEARWSASNPNIVTMRNRGSQALVETKVTKRSTEGDPAQFTFGTSEYARVADAGGAGVMGAVPRILATRERVRYRWAEDVTTSGRIEGLSIEQLFDPTQTGFGDIAGATPVLSVKARLTLQRLPPL